MVQASLIVLECRSSRRPQRTNRVKYAESEVRAELRFKHALAGELDQPELRSPRDAVGQHDCATDEFAHDVAVHCRMRPICR